MADYYIDVKIFWPYDQARNVYGSRQALPITDGSRHKTQCTLWLILFWLSVGAISSYDHVSFGLSLKKWRSARTITMFPLALFKKREDPKYLAFDHVSFGIFENSISLILTVYYDAGNVSSVHHRLLHLGELWKEMDATVCWCTKIVPLVATGNDRLSYHKILHIQ